MIFIRFTIHITMNKNIYTKEKACYAIIFCHVIRNL